MAKNGANGQGGEVFQVRLNTLGPRGNDPSKVFFSCVQFGLWKLNRSFVTCFSHACEGKEELSIVDFPHNEEIFFRRLKNGKLCPTQYLKFLLYQAFLVSEKFVCVLLYRFLRLVNFKA